MRSNLFTLLRNYCAVLFLLLVTFSFAQDEITGDSANGYKLFDKQCTTCHKPESVENVLTGPGLLNVAQRLQEEQGLGRDWLQKWITNSPAMVESGDAYAVDVYNRFNQTPMNVFEGILSEQDIDDILVYLQDPTAGKAAFDAAEAERKRQDEAERLAAEASKGSNTGAIIIGFVILGILLLWILLRLNALVKLTAAEELLADDEAKVTNFTDAFEKYKKIGGAVMAVLTFLALYGVWNLLLGIGVDKGYQPEQPIYFSHKIHNGIQGIDCQYCHSAAKYGKVSNIPSANLCMNCHREIDEYAGEDEASQRYIASLVKDGEYESADAVKEFYTGEIHKMYESIGWNPKDKEYMDTLQKPIKWLRIHNMPDFVYFPHSQHVVVGEKTIKKAMEEGTIPNAKELGVSGDDPVCFACHGDVGKMDEVYMANQFTMGWCIECHRTTEVDMENEYNKEYYEDLHEKLKKEYGDKTKITVDAIGGLECGKCHY